MYFNRVKSVLASTAALSLLLAATTTQAVDKLDQVLSTGQKAIKEGQASQGRVDGIVEQSDKLFQEFKSVNKQIDGLKVYNAQLSKQIDNQNKQLSQLENSIRQASVMGRQISPLMLRMLDSLEKFVELDMPFHVEERAKRITKLRANEVRSDLSDAEKFRQILEAYKIEIEYGRKMDTYTSLINLDGEEREVKIFRVGRISLLFQTADANVTGYWNNQDKQWTHLDGGSYRTAVRQGIRIAKKQSSIEILNLPISAPESAK
jgi:flagellar biosynthesis/type III secretory pathway chaperone